MLRQHALEKKVVDKIKEQKVKERREKISRLVKHTFITTKRTTQKDVEKEDKSRFNNAWFAGESIMVGKC